MFSCSRNQQPDSGDELDRDRDRDRDDRDDSEQRSSRAGGGQCKGKENCEELCEQLFGRGQKKTKCIALTVNEVEAMHLAFNDDSDGDEGFLVNPDYEDDLEKSDLHPDDIYNVLKIDDSYWSDLIDDYSTGEAKDVMLWLAEDSDIFEAVERALKDEDDEMDFLADLFKQAGSNVASALTLKLGKDSDPEDTFMTLTIDSSLRDVAHQVLIDHCLKDANSSNSWYPYSRRVADGRQVASCSGDACQIPNVDYQKSACALGEVYCKKDGRGDYIFEESFESILDAVTNDLSDYITEPPVRSKPKSALGFDNDNNKEEDDIEKVCQAFCPLWSNIRTVEYRPTTCR